MRVERKIVVVRRARISLNGVGIGDFLQEGR